MENQKVTIEITPKGWDIKVEIGEHTFDIDELSEFFESEPTPSRESEYREVLEEMVKQNEMRGYGESADVIKAKQILNK